ncbi:fimbrial protein [Salmonella enterica]|nr:fimbrial protein [Salmonella enterica]
MKKTVIAVALASTVFSGAAMAWEASGSGGNIEIGGSIQVTPYSTPWEVMAGAPATSLDANITKGVSVVNIPVTKPIPVLGIRTAAKTPFPGGPGLAPQINFNNSVDFSQAQDEVGVGALTLDVINETDSSKIGTMTAPIFAGAVMSQKGNSSDDAFRAVAAGSPGQLYAFEGGLPEWNKSAKGNTIARLNELSPEIMANFDKQGLEYDSKGQIANFRASYLSFSSAYGAGIHPNQNIKLTLTAPANDAIKWKASLPITVSYQ